MHPCNSPQEPHRLQPPATHIILWDRVGNCVAQLILGAPYLLVGGYTACLLCVSLYELHAADAYRGEFCAGDVILGTLLLISLYGVAVGLAGKGVGWWLLAWTRRYSGRLPVPVFGFLLYGGAILMVYSVFQVLHFWYG